MATAERALKMIKWCVENLEDSPKSFYQQVKWIVDETGVEVEAIRTEGNNIVSHNHHPSAGETITGLDISEKMLGADEVSRKGVRKKYVAPSIPFSGKSVSDLIQETEEEIDRMGKYPAV